MRFQKFFLIQERQYFIDLIYFTEKISAKLKHHIKNNKIKIGKKIPIEIDDDNVINFIFKNKPDIFTSPTTVAEYDFLSHNIYIYVKNIIQGYKLKVDDMNKFFSANFSLIDSTLRHELSHAYEDMVKNIQPFTHKTHNEPEEKMFGSKKENDYAEYINREEEIHAFFIQKIPEMILKNPAIRNSFDRKNINKTVKLILKKLENEVTFFDFLYPRNKKRVLKLIYTFVQDLLYNKKPA